MALFHLNVTQIKRSKGQSAIAAAAYRAGEKLYSEYYGETSDYTNKGGVICSEILLPPHVPREYADRQTLWNAVEKAERGKNAQLAYSFDIALQNEFSLDENIALARQFLLAHFVSRGMVVDFAIHVPDTEPGGIQNPHFHVMAPIRPIEANGKWGLKQRRVYELDDDGNRLLDADGNYVFNAVPTTDWGSPETLEYWREQWAAMCNGKFEEKGLPERIDHRSYERQGVDILPTIHEGPSVRQMEAKGIRTDKGEFNRWIKATNSLIQNVRNKIAALLDWLKETKAELAKPQTLDLFSLLQAYFNQRNSGAYSQRAKVNNLKEYSELCQFLLDHSITDITALENHVNDLRTTTDSLKKKLDAQTAQMKTLRKIPEYFDDYKRLKPVFDGLQKIKFTKAREKYKADHAADLKRFYEARRVITQKFPEGKYDRKALEAEYAELERQHDATYAEFKTIRAESQTLWKIKSHIDTARKNNPVQVASPTQKQEQEI
ncbi:MAG: MobQ family relaxase [Faecousia sp.]